MHEATVSYDEFLAGRHRVSYGIHPIGLFMQQRGARVRTNQFLDRELIPSGELSGNLLSIVQSGRRQGFEKLRIVIFKIHFPVSYHTVGRIMALEKVIIDTESTSEAVVLTVIYPEIIWCELTHWNASTRTELHSDHMAHDELKRLKQIYQYVPISGEDRRIVEKSVG